MVTAADLVSPPQVVGRHNTPYGQVVRFVREPDRAMPVPPSIDPDHPWVRDDRNRAELVLRGSVPLRGVAVHLAHVDGRLREPTTPRSRVPGPVPVLGMGDLSDIVKGV